MGFLFVFFRSLVRRRFYYTGRVPIVGLPELGSIQEAILKTGRGGETSAKLEQFYEKNKTVAPV